MGSKFTHVMRAEELRIAYDLLPRGGKVLDLGAGDGWQANNLAKAGFHVTAVDVDAERIGPTPAYPVGLYDGYTLPYADATFDAVYSSNVMEHVEAFEQVQRELARVLRPGGIALHCVPSGVWRFWTSATHPVYAAKMMARMAIGRGRPQAALQERLQSAHGRLGRIARMLKLGLVSPRHGEHGTWLGEHFLFTRRRWAERFARSGWVVQEIVPVGVVYTGNENLGTAMRPPARRRLARLLGSSAVFFLLTPGTTNNHGN